MDQLSGQQREGRAAQQHGIWEPFGASTALTSRLRAPSPAHQLLRDGRTSNIRCICCRQGQESTMIQSGIPLGLLEDWFLLAGSLLG